jgi:hypothetical protein
VIQDDELKAKLLLLERCLQVCIDANPCSMQDAIAETMSHADFDPPWSLLSTRDRLKRRLVCDICSNNPISTNIFVESFQSHA